MSMTSAAQFGQLPSLQQRQNDARKGSFRLTAINQTQDDTVVMTNTSVNFNADLNAAGTDPAHQRSTSARFMQEGMLGARGSPHY